MRHPARRPSRRLVAVLVIAAAVGATAGVATAQRSDSPAPPPDKPLAAAVLGSLMAPAPPGIVADVEVTNRLLPASGATKSFAGTSQGTLRVAAGGAFRLTLASTAGRVEITGDDQGVALHDDRSSTTYSLPVTLHADREKGLPMGLVQRMMRALGRSVRRGGAGARRHRRPPGLHDADHTPRRRGPARRCRGRVGRRAAGAAAARRVRLRRRRAVLDIRLSDVSYGRVDPATVAAAPHRGARHVDVAPASGVPNDAAGASGLRAVRARAGFDVALPRTLAGLPRRAVGWFAPTATEPCSRRTAPGSEP